MEPLAPEVVSEPVVEEQIVEQPQLVETPVHEEIETDSEVTIEPVSDTGEEHPTSGCSPRRSIINRLLKSRSRNIIPK